MRIFIFYYEVFKQQKDNKAIIGVGGIQTYLYNLANLLSSNYKTSIVQFGSIKDTISYNNFDIFFFKSRKKSLSGIELFSYMKKELNNNDLIIWGTDSIALKTNYKSILIQHGVAFDYYPEEKLLPQFLKNLGIDIFYRILQQIRSYRLFEKSDYKVCVDYNYLNWFELIQIEIQKIFCNFHFSS